MLSAIKIHRMETAQDQEPEEKDAKNKVKIHKRKTFSLILPGNQVRDRNFRKHIKRNEGKK